MRTRIFALALAVTAMVGSPSIASAGPLEDCFGEDIERRISGCSKLIDSQDPTTDFPLVFAMRGLAYSISGDYTRAIADLDMAIGLKPDFAVALNNRAWAYFRSGKTREALPDIEKAIELNPTSPHSYDTRAHLRQSLGDREGAMRDYDRAMSYGRDSLTKLYQCGLAERGLYAGAVDGRPRPDLLKALEACTAMPDCDPLPPDEKCR